MKLKMINLFLALILSIFLVTENTYANKAYEELSSLGEECSEYAGKAKDNTILKKYPEFDEAKYSFKNANGYKFLDPNSMKDKKGYPQTIRIYDYSGKNAADIYKNLISIINKKRSKNIVLRPALPANNAEDKVMLTTSVKDENYGYTCYIKKSDSEYWIKTEPVKDKKAVFIIDGKNGKLYYRENILNNE